MPPAFLAPASLPARGPPPRRATCARRSARSSVSLPRPAAATAAAPSEESAASPERIFDGSALDAAVAHTPGLLVFEVFSSRCRACMAMKRTVRKVAASFAAQARFLQLDADDDVHLAQRLGVRAMPTFILYKDGKRVDHFASSSGDRLRLYIEDNL